MLYLLSMGKLTFHGGALSVTGANYLLETEKSKVLVDCGLFQGGKRCNPENYEDFPYNPSEIDAVFITHAHIDHIGRLPKLIKDGYSGPIYATAPTLALAAIMLDDSQGLLEHECKGKRHQLYSRADVQKTVEYFKPIEYGNINQALKDIKVRFRDAGHILGSSIIEIWVQNQSSQTVPTTVGSDSAVADGNQDIKFVFSGDLGNSPTPLLNDTEFIEDADYVLVESVYGNRIHEDREERKELLENAIEDTISRGGTLMVPSFAIERTQEMLYELNSLVKNNRIPKIPIFLDSPLAIDATKVYRKYKNFFNKNTMQFLKSGRKLFKFPNLKFTYSTKESKAINNVPSPKMIIAGSGMSTGGRILHHEKRYLSDPNSMLLIIGYQAKGTLGRKLFDGEKEIKLFGETIQVNCNIRAIGGYSAHADQKGLYEWVNAIKKGGEESGRVLKKVFCIQGEEEAAHALATKIRDNLIIDAHVPKKGEVFEF